MVHAMQGIHRRTSDAFWVDVNRVFCESSFAVAGQDQQQSRIGR
jgi:hypothetical protein